MFRSIAGLVFAVILAGFGVHAWVKSYLHSSEFRIFIADTVGAELGADARFKPLEWQGMAVHTDGFCADNGDIIRRLRADGMRGSVGFSAIRRGVWEIEDLRIDKLDAVIGDTDRQEAVTEDFREGESSETSRTGSGFFMRWLPDRAELKGAEVSSINLIFHTAGGGLHASDVAMRVERSKEHGNYDVQLLGGSVQSPWLGSPLKLQSARGKFKNGRIYLNESRLRVYQHGMLSLRGELDQDDFAFHGALSDVGAEELLAEDWKKRITGDVNTKFKVQRDRDRLSVRGELRLERGVITALPLLDRMAAYANTQRFRRLNLSEAQLDYIRKGKSLELKDILIASEGLVRVTGNLTVVDGRLDGRFRVGIMPGLLTHIPGAETKVFVRGERGLLWAPLHITGTVEDPKEDLSQRLIAAAGERMFELVPETGQRALKFAHDTATEIPAKALEAGVGVVDEGVEAVREGAEIIREGLGGVLELIPEPSGERE